MSKMLKVDRTRYFAPVPGTWRYPVEPEPHRTGQFNNLVVGGHVFRYPTNITHQRRCVFDGIWETEDSRKHACDPYHWYGIAP